MSRWWDVGWDVWWDVWWAGAALGHRTDMVNGECTVEELVACEQLYPSHDRSIIAQTISMYYRQTGV